MNMHKSGFDEHEVIEVSQSEKPLSKINNFITAANDFCNQANVGIEHITQVYQQSMQLKRDVAAINAWTDVELAKIAAKYKSCETFLNKTFGEREKTLNKLYDQLDKAIESNDRELIIMAMKGMSDIVTSSPLSDFEKFVDLYNNASKPLLDF